MIQFHETMMGRRFYEGTMPDLVNEVEELRKTLDKGIKVQGLEELTAALNRCANALENSCKAEHAQKEKGTDEDPLMSHTACTDGQTCHPDGTEEVVSKPEPFHITATPDESGYTITIPEHPEISAHCEDAADIIPTATKAKAEDRQRRVCPKCGKEYTDAPALSRKDNTDICPECGTREALEDAGFSQDEQHEIIETIYHKHDSLPDPDSFTPEERKTYKKRLSAVKRSWRAIQKVEKKYLTEELCLAAIQKSKGWAMSYITNQTPALCLAAVKHCKLNLVCTFLERATEQSPELCLEAVKKDGWALRYVKEQTAELCLEAVKQNGLALEFVKDQTPDICLAAVRQNPWALAFVKDQTPDICFAAIGENEYAIQYVRNQTAEICLEVVKKNASTLRYIKEQTPEVCLEAVTKNGLMLRYVNTLTDSFCLAAVEQNGMALKYVPKREQTRAIAVAALKQNPESRRYLATKFRKPEVYKEAGLDQSMTHD